MVRSAERAGHECPLEAAIIACEDDISMYGVACAEGGKYGHDLELACKTLLALKKREEP